MANNFKKLVEKVNPTDIQDSLKNLKNGAKGFANDKLKDLNKSYGEFKDKYVGKPLESIEGLVDTVGDSVDAIVGGATTGVMESEVFPKDFARELCFRMDFYEYDRSDRFQKAKKHPVATVILPLPRNIATQTSIGYSTESLGLGGIVENALRGVDGGGGISSIEQLKALAADVGKAGGSIGESLALKAANSLSDGAVGAVAGFIPNPHLATLFTGMDIRNFNFSIQCTSTSPEDSAALHNIINIMKRYSLPSLSQKRISLSYPHEVFISFSEAGYADPPRTPLDNIFKFKRCVLKGINITVGSQGTPSFFNNLEPTEMTIDLEFTETQIETANDYGAAAGEDLSTKAAATAGQGLKSIGDGIQASADKLRNT